VTRRRVSFVVVNWHEEEATARCVKSIRAQTAPVEAEVIVVDNGTSAASRAALARIGDVRLVTHRENRGFAGGANSGVALASGEVVAIVNNDCVLAPDWLAEGLAVLADAGVGIVGGAEYRWDEENPAFSLDNGLHSRTLVDPELGFSRRLAGPAPSGDVTTLDGSNLLVRTALFRELGGFEPSFFAYYEDLDLCARCWAVGARVRFSAEMAVWHRRNLSSQRIPYLRRMLSDRNHMLAVARHFPEAEWDRLVRRIALQYVYFALTGREGAFRDRRSKPSLSPTERRAHVVAGLWALTHRRRLRASRSSLVEAGQHDEGYRERLRRDDARRPVDATAGARTGAGAPRSRGGLPPALPGARRAPRVALDARYLRRPDVGISVYLRSAIDDLIGAGWRVTLLTDDEADALRLGSAFPHAEAVALACRSGLAFEQVQVLRYLRRRRPDVFVAPANWGIPLLYAGRTVLVVVVHDLIPLRRPAMYLLGDVSWSAKYLVSSLIAALRADWVIANSRATADDVARLWRRRRVRTVYPAMPMPVPVPAPPPGSAGARQPSGEGPPHEPGYFVYTGGAGPRKNLPALFGALEQLRRAGDTRPLLVTGSAGALITSMAGARLERSVVATGSLPVEELRRVVAEADAVVYPSLLEGFGLPVVEALASGTPVVCARLPAFVEVAGELPHYVDVTDAGALARAMREAAETADRGALRQLAASRFAALASHREAAGIVPALEEILSCRT